MKDIRGHVLTNIINSTPPPAHMSKSPEKARDEELATQVGYVTARLEAEGYDPVRALVSAVRAGGLSPQQEAAVNKWLMDKASEESKVSKVQVSGNVEHVHRDLQAIDAWIAGHLGSDREESNPTPPRTN